MKHSIPRLLKRFLPIIRRKKDRPIPRRKKWIPLLELLSSELPLIASDFVIHETTEGIRLALKRSLTELRHQRHACSSYSCSFFFTIPRPFLSFRSRSTFLARRRSALFKRRTFGKRRFYAIPSGRAFRFRSGRFFELSLIKLNESQRRSDAVIFHRARALKRTQMQRTASSIFLGNIRLAADTVTAKFNCKRENFRSISFLSFLSRRPRTSGYAANFKPGFSDSTDR